MARRRGKRESKSLSHDPRVLHAASIERIMEADVCFKKKYWTITIYLAGLAVECILQALALRDDPKHDSRHDLTKWLGKCPRRLENTLKSIEMGAHWNHLNTVWYNEIRYLSEAGLLGHLRKIGHAGKSKTGREAILRQNADSLLESANLVHKKGLAAWPR